MKKILMFGIILMICALIVPVAACNAFVTKTGPGVECPTCSYFEYVIVVSTDHPGAGVKVVDTLPAGLTFLSSSPIAPSMIEGQKLTWFMTVEAPETITLRVKPSSPSVTSVQNFATAWARPDANSPWGGVGTSQTVTTSFSTSECHSTSAPEFPSTVIPATCIIGLLGTVLLIRKTREH